MLSRGYIIRAGKRMLICVLMLTLLFSCAQAETVTATSTDLSAMEAAAAAASVNPDGAQMQTGPVLMVTDYSIIEGEAVPGSSFVLEMSIANLSEKMAAHNVLATLTIENLSVSLQQGATNQKYYHEIKPLETVTAQFPLEVYSYCTEENMILTMTMGCYDGAGFHYDFQTMMTPDIEVARTLHVSSLTVPQFVHRNSSMIISATLANTEPVPLNKVRMHVITQYGEQVTEVGQMLKNQNKTIECMYRFPEQKTEDVQIFFTYESLYGHQYSTEVQSYEVIVYDPAEASDFQASDSMSLMESLERLVQGTEIPGTEIRLPIPVVVWILLGCIGYAVVLYFVLRKKGR